MKKDGNTALGKSLKLAKLHESIVGTEVEGKPITILL